MSATDALEAAIEAAVERGLERQLAAQLPALLRAAVAELHIGDTGDELVDAAGAARVLGTTANALRRANERGTAPVPAIRLEPVRRLTPAGGHGESETKPRPRLRWRKRDLLAYVAAQREGGAGR